MTGCGHPAFRIRGWCADCAPWLHAEHRAERAAYAALADEFTRQTGLNALECADVFDAWAGV